MTERALVSYLLAEVGVRVLRHRGWLVQPQTQFSEEVLCEQVTVGHCERARVKHYVFVDVEMENVVELVVVGRRQRDAVPMDERSCHRDDQRYSPLYCHTCGSLLQLDHGK